MQYYIYLVLYFISTHNFKKTIMTTYKTARKIIMKFYYILDWKLAQQCALICVDQIIEEDVNLNSQALDY